MHSDKQLETRDPKSYAKLVSGHVLMYSYSLTRSNTVNHVFMYTLSIQLQRIKHYCTASYQYYILRAAQQPNLTISICLENGTAYDEGSDLRCNQRGLLFPLQLAQKVIMIQERSYHRICLFIYIYICIYNRYNTIHLPTIRSGH